MIDKLVGNIHAVGHTDIDNDNFVNLKNIISIVYHYISKIMDECEKFKRFEYSMKRSGKESIDFLRDIQEEIKDILVEYEIDK